MLGNLFSQRKNAASSSGQAAAGGSGQPAATGQDTVVQAPAGQQAPSPAEPGQPELVGSAMKPQLRQDLSILTHLDSRTGSVLHQAEQEARRIKQITIEEEQLLYGLLFDAEIFDLFAKLSLDTAKLSQSLQAIEKTGVFDGQPTLSESAKHVFEKAYAFSKSHESDFVTPEDVLLTLFSSNHIATFLQSQGVKKEQIEELMSQSGKASIAKKSVLSKFGLDLTQQAREGKLDPVVGRDKEVERLVHILLRRTKNNPIIIGEAGTGKTALIEGLAEAISHGTAPKDLLQKCIIQLDVSSLVAGASHRGEFEERLRDVIKETQASNGQIILFIDEIHTLMGTGDSDGALDASNIIKPFLARGQLQIIGTTTTMEFRKYFEKDKAFARRFQPIIVEEPDEETAVKMLQVLKPKYENFHHVVLTDEALQAAVHLSKKYIGERFLPDKAVDLLDEAAADVRLRASGQTATGNVPVSTQQVPGGVSADNQVKKQDIEKVVSSWTGIPITKLTEDESLKLLKLEELIHKRLIGQDTAVQAVSEAVRRGRIGLASANRPIASFIFLGPTGTGKTELAKTLAEILFGKDDAMIRLDMSEYMEKHEVAKLIGAPPGYVGYEEGGQLTEAVRRKPYSVVLLDEVEKAHPDVFNILLQLLEDGRLTDNKGNTISFKNTIVIATSNIGSALIQQKLLEQAQQDPAKPQDQSKKSEDLSQAVMGELKKFFRPELLNRFDELVMFEPLKQSDMVSITKLRIEGTRKLLREQNIDITATEKALVQLGKEGYDPLYGARPLRRLIQTSIENPVAMMIIQKAFIPGDTVVVDYDESKGSYAFTKAAAQQQSSQPPFPPQQTPPVMQQPGNGVPQGLQAMYGPAPTAPQTTPSMPVPPPPPPMGPPPVAASGNGLQMQPTPLGKFVN